MKKILYITPTARFVRIKPLRLMAGSKESIPTDETPITNPDNIGAKGTSFDLWEDVEE